MRSNFPRTNIRQTEGLRTLCRRRHRHHCFRHETSLRSKGTCVSPSSGTFIWPALGFSPRTQQRHLYELCHHPAVAISPPAALPRPLQGTRWERCSTADGSHPSPPRGAGTAASCPRPQTRVLPSNCGAGSANSASSAGDTHLFKHFHQSSG